MPKTQQKKKCLRLDLKKRYRERKKKIRVRIETGKRVLKYLKHFISKNGDFARLTFFNDWLASTFVLEKAEHAPYCQNS